MLPTRIVSCHGVREMQSVYRNYSENMNFDNMIAARIKLAIT